MKSILLGGIVIVGLLTLMTAAWSKEPVHGEAPSLLYADKYGFSVFLATLHQGDKIRVAQADKQALLDSLDSVISSYPEPLLRQRLAVMRDALSRDTLMAAPYQSNGMLLLETPRKRSRGEWTYLVTTPKEAMPEKPGSPWLPFVRAGGTCYQAPALCIEEPTRLSPCIRAIVAAHELRHWLYRGDEFGDYQMTIGMARVLGGPQYQQAVELEKKRIRASEMRARNAGKVSKFIRQSQLPSEVLEAFGCPCPDQTSSDWAFRNTFVYLDAYFQVIQERNAKSSAAAEVIKRQFVDWHSSRGFIER